MNGQRVSVELFIKIRVSSTVGGNMTYMSSSLGTSLVRQDTSSDKDADGQPFAHPGLDDLPKPNRNLANKNGTKLRVPFATSSDSDPS